MKFTIVQLMHAINYLFFKRLHKSLISIRDAVEGMVNSLIGKRMIFHVELSSFLQSIRKNNKLKNLSRLSI